MNTVDLLGKRDIPLTTSMLGFMQSAYENLEKLGALGGDNYILSGCDVNGTNVSAGWMVLNGLVMPFLGGTKIATIKIVKTESDIVVAEGTRKQITYQAEFGSTSTPGYQFNWADLDVRRVGKRDAVATSALPNFSTQYCRVNYKGDLLVINGSFQFYMLSGTIYSFEIAFDFDVPASLSNYHFTVMVDNEVVRATVVSLSPFTISMGKTFTGENEPDIHINVPIIL